MIEKAALTKVVIAPCSAYNTKTIKKIIQKSIQKIDFVPGESKVLLKPNLLSAKPPEKAVTTHPSVVQAVAEIFLDSSCIVYIGDSPGYEPTGKVLSHSGIMDVVISHGLKVRSFNQKVKKRFNGISPYREFTLGEDPRDYDLIINMPKLKTHTMMGMTLGVKNTFGFIPSLDKAKWHLRAGRDTMLFASLLIDIHRVVNPSLTILDGITGMDGDGPSSGRVRDFGIVGVSRDAFSLDRCIEMMAGVSAPLPISRIAKENGLLECADVDAPIPPSVWIDEEMVRIDNFKPPATMGTDWNLPQLAKRILRGILVKKPKIDSTMCKNCRVCVKVCPAGALSESQKTPVFDYKRCIRCYCCQEMCPEGAIRAA